MEDVSKVVDWASKNVTAEQLEQAKDFTKKALESDVVNSGMLKEIRDDIKEAIDEKNATAAEPAGEAKRWISWLSSKKSGAAAPPAAALTPADKRKKYIKFAIKNWHYLAPAAGAAVSFLLTQLWWIIIVGILVLYLKKKRKNKQA